MAVVRFYLLLTLIYLSTSVVAQVDLEKGLLACYAFSGNTNDGSGHNYHGTLQGASLTADRYGNPGKAYLFDGIDDYVHIPSSPLSNRNYTFAMWIRPMNFVTGQHGGVISIGDEEGSDHGVEIAYAPNYIEPSALALTFRGTFSPTSILHSGCPLFSPNQWHHIVVARTDTRAITYIDGVLISDPTVNIDGSPAPYYKLPLTALIGMRSNFKFPFSGVIDDVAIYNRALSAEEVWKLYSEGLLCAALPIPNVSDLTQCGEGPITLTASGGSNYRWYDSETNGDLIFEGNPFTAHASNTIAYYVSNVTDEGESKRRKVTVTINPQPELLCYFPSTVFSEDAEIYRVETTSGSSPYNYNFNFGDGTAFNTPDSEQEHIYYKEGLYLIQVVATDLMGCEATCSVPIEIIKEEFFIPNIITPNDDQHNEIFTLYVKTGDSYQAYSGKKTFSLHIYNRWGGEVFSSNNAMIGWKAEQAATGVYFFEILIGKNKFKGTVVVRR